MSEFQKGMLVQHASLGLGKIVGVEEKALHVFFVGRDSRFAAKLRLPDAAGMLTTAPASAGAWIGGASAFTLDESSGRYALAESWISHEEAVARFLEVHPGGFAPAAQASDLKGPRGRPARLRRGHEAFVEAFGDGRGERLLEEGALPKLTDAVARIEKLAAPCATGADKASLVGPLREGEGAREYFGALFALLAAPAPAPEAFTALAAAVAGLPGAGASAWQLATALPFLAQPDRHLLLRPKLVNQAALRLGFELRFTAEPSWATYSTLLRSAGQLLERLAPIGARDLIDVETFLATAAVRPATRPAT